MNSTPGETSEPEQPSSAGSDDPFDVVLDEDFIRGAAAKEQSARARELAARWAKQPPTQTGWRSDGPSPYQAPGPTPSAGQKGTKKPKLRRSGRGASRVVLRNTAIFIVTAAIAVMLLYPRHHDPAPVNAAPAGTAQPWADSSGAGSPSPSPSPTFTNPDDTYFADSPSLTWANNADGIVLPAAAKVGSFSASQVADGYAQMKKLLAAGNLDATILDGGPLTDFTTLIDPLDKVTDRLDQWLRAPTYHGDPTELVTRFNPKTTRLLGHIVKVRGAMSASLGKNQDLLITGDYRFVYAVGPADGAGSPSRSVVHRLYQISIFKPGEYESTPGTTWLYLFNYDIANSACFVYNGFINPQFGSNGVAAPGKTVDPYASSNLQPATGSAASASPRPTGSPTECDSVSQL